MMWVISHPARFWVTRIPMDYLEKEQIKDWVEDAWAIWGSLPPPF